MRNESMPSTGHPLIATLTVPDSINVGVIRDSLPMPDGDGRYPAVHALIERDADQYGARRFATSVVYFNDDTGHWGACWGRYDMTLAEAAADLTERHEAEKR